MARDDALFTPEAVDEQIEQLAGAPGTLAPERGQPTERRLIQNLQRLYETEKADERSIEAVWERLAQQNLAGLSRRSHPSLAGRILPSAGRHSPQEYAPAPRVRRGWSYRLMGMAAAVMLVALVGGLVVGLVLVHHPQNGAAPTATPETTAAPTPTQKPTAPPQNLYAILDGNTVVALNPADGTVKWRYPFSGASEALPPSLTVMNNTVYLWVSQNLVALNASDGTQRWEAKNVGVTGFIWMTKELVFTLPSPTSSGVTLIALNVSDGTVRWSSQQPIHPMDVTANGDAVYVQTQLPATLFVLNVSNGKERWHFGVANSIESVTGDGDTVYVTSGLPETLWALNANNGNVRWHASATDATKFITPTVVNGVVYAPLDGYIQSGGGPAILYALQASDGKELWHSPQAQAGIYYSTPAVSDGVVYTADQQYVYAFNAENGQMRWNSNVGPIYEPAAPIVMNGLIYVESGLGGGSGTLATVIHALNPADGKEVWNFHQELPVDGFPGPLIPLVTNGLVYAYGPSGGAVALDASTGKQLWQNNSNLSDLVIG